MKNNGNNTIIQNRVIESDFFIWKIFYPSLSTNVKFIKLFTKIYPEFLVNFSIGSLMWDRNKLRIVFTNKSIKEKYTIYFQSNNNRCNSKLCTDKLCIWLHKSINDKYFLKFLVLFSINMKNFWIDDILNILTTDIKAKQDYYNLLFRADIPEYSIMKDWGSPIHDFRFIFIEHKSLDVWFMLTFLIKEIYIHHTERECGQKNPTSSSWKRNLYSFFEEDIDFLMDNYDGYFYLSDEEKKKYDLWEFKYSRYEEFTDLSDDDIIMWYSNDRLNETVEKVNKTIEEDNEIKVVTYSCSCVPVIIWDNFENFKKLNKVNVPVIHEWQLSKSNYDMKLHLFYNELKKYFDDWYSYNIDKNTISLFWFFNNEELISLNTILQFNWIKIKSVYVPIFDFKLIPFLFESELFIYTDSTRFNQIYNDTFKCFFKDKWINLPLPIWVNWTTNWLNSIFNKLWININLDDKSKKYIDQFNRKKELIKKQDLRVWFVLFWLRDFNVLSNPTYSNDIDIIEFIKEMWFGIDFYVVDHIKENYYEYNFWWYFWDKDLIKSEINKKLSWYENFNINFYNNKSSLYKDMEEWNTSLFYSDIFFDDRLIRMWRNSFNIRTFKIWYKWALETIDEFIKLSKVWYFNNLNKYRNYGL